MSPEAKKSLKHMQVSFSELEIKHAEWSYLSQKELLHKLFRAESEEYYEECTEILKYAESKGWDFKRKDE